MTVRLLVILVLVLYGTISAQNSNLLQYSQQRFQEMRAEKAEAEAWAKRVGMEIRSEFSDGTIVEIQRLRNGRPVYYVTNNANAAITTRTNWLYPGGGLGLSITGSGYDKLGEWDGGAVLGTHQELSGRVTQVDGASSVSDHSTHVAGTLIAAGVQSAARGMAYQSNLDAYDWNTDDAEMAAAAAAGMEVSNHSYGQITGWYWNGSLWLWYGDIQVSTNEDYTFGLYDSQAQNWDQIAVDAPNYLIVKSAGNDRNDAASGLHAHYDSNGPSGPGFYYATDSHPADGGASGYDCISGGGTAKNVMTIAAVNDVPSYSAPGDVAMSSFSGWGPTDDGRIKPDISANGINLYSCIGTGNTDYDGTYSGTSMASPNAAGTLALLQQHYQNTHSGAIMRSATLKALAINTADEAGSADGPDYAFGWGLLNAKAAAQTITQDLSVGVIKELSLSNGGQYSTTVTTTGIEALKVTLCWTDPPGTPPAASLDPADVMLVNDLNLRVNHGGQISYPWSLDGQNPSNAATASGPNSVDNVEQVYIASPIADNFIIEVDHSGTLASAQAFSLVISGVSATDVSLPVQLTSFSAELQPGSVQLRWVTASEMQNAGFLLTGRIIGNLEDFKIAGYETAPALRGRINSAEESRYRFNDSQLFPGDSVIYNLWQQDVSGARHLLAETVLYHDPDRLVPANPEIAEVYPNPFNPKTSVQIDLPEVSRIRAVVFDISGRQVRQLTNARFTAGKHRLEWDGKTASGKAAGSGIYFLKISAGKHVVVRKLMLVR